MIDLYNGDCLELMKSIPDHSIDMILSDPPYGTTKSNDWDKPVDLSALWTQYKRVIKSGGAIVLFSQLPFACDLIAGNRKQFRYEWVWEKDCAVGFLNANRMPLRAHENILVFYDRLPTYNPQMNAGKPYARKRHGHTTNYNVNTQRLSTVNKDGKRYPRDVIRFQKETGFHPTQKPVALLEYLIKTYTNESDTVLDSFMGSGSTGVACVNTGRSFIGMELDKNYFKIAQNRIAEA
jgi:site-specific DNA-methyltransferase (adenine-specific)